jgi:hypothetical protein
MAKHSMQSVIAQHAQHTGMIVNTILADATMTTTAAATRNCICVCTTFFLTIQTPPHFQSATAKSSAAVTPARERQPSQDDSNRTCVLRLRTYSGLVFDVSSDTSFLPHSSGVRS